MIAPGGRGAGAGRGQLWVIRQRRQRMHRRHGRSWTSSGGGTRRSRGEISRDRWARVGRRRGAEMMTRGRRQARKPKTARLGKDRRTPVQATATPRHGHQQWRRPRLLPPKRAGKHHPHRHRARRQRREAASRPWLPVSLLCPPRPSLRITIAIKPRSSPQHLWELYDHAYCLYITPRRELSQCIELS